MFFCFCFFFSIVRYYSFLNRAFSLNLAQKRQACLDEITRLKTEGAMMDVNQKTNYNESEGVLTISDIRLPLKQAFVIAIAEGKHGQYIYWK